MSKIVPSLMKMFGVIIVILSLLSLWRFFATYEANSMYVEAHWSAVGYWGFQISKFLGNLTLAVQFFGIGKILEQFNKLKSQNTAQLQ